MISLRHPSSLPSSTPSPSLPPPSLTFLSGHWNVTHSTLPMWKKNRNVRITYTPITSTTPPQIDDLVTYQPLKSTMVKTVRGIDRPFDVPNTEASGDADQASMAYHWRGKGWLMIASSKWEVLGYGEEEGTGNSWVVTYFAKTLFTPAGVDFYSRKGALTPQTVEGIKTTLLGMGGEVEKMAEKLFEIGMDEDRKD